ncbi:hypothetical protein A2U01_0067943, partial [Trifolium medium]|nr:hypothetical protein [Trifolium medium]
FGLRRGVSLSCGLGEFDPMFSELPQQVVSDIWIDVSLELP